MKYLEMNDFDIHMNKGMGYFVGVIFFSIFYIRTIC